jgi:hypothetical protein
MFMIRGIHYFSPGKKSSGIGLYFLILVVPTTGWVFDI